MAAKPQAESKPVEPRTKQEGEKQKVKASELTPDQAMVYAALGLSEQA